MALTDSGGVGRTVEFGVNKIQVVLSRACRAGDVLGVAADNFDDLGPAYSAAAAHSTAVTYVARLVAGEDGAAGDTIIAYTAATVSGYSSAAAFNKVYMAQTSGTAGQISETVPTGTGSCGDIVGMSVATNRVVLSPFHRPPMDSTTAV